MKRAAALVAAAALCSACGAGAHHAAAIRLHCTGAGRPVVVLESGLDATHAAWSNVQPSLSRTTRTCSYDRLRGSRTAVADVADLHALLARAHVPGPYVLVGHSFGGILVDIYAHRRPHDVAGLVLVDSEAPWQRRAFLVALGRPRRGEPVVAQRLRTFLSRPQPNAEGLDVAGALASARAAGPLGARPLVVIEAGLENSAALPVRLRFLLDRTWFALQSRLAALSTHHIHVVAPISGHDVLGASGEPDLVVAAVRAVVYSVRDRRPLPACADVFARFAAQCVSG